MRSFASGRNFFDDVGMSSRLSDYDYPFPRDLIARRPLPNRDESRMMVLRRDKQTIEHRQFRELKEFFDAGRSACVERHARAGGAKIFRRRRN